VMGWGAILIGVRAACQWVTGSKLGRVLLVVAGIALAILVSYSMGRARGAARESARCKEQANWAMVVAQESNRKQEMTHAREIQELQTKFSQQQQQAAAVDARALADFGSGSRRMRFPLAPRCPAAPAATGATGRVDATQAADIAPATAEALYSIAADGDEAIRQLTALQSWVREALKLCGQQGGR
jgi:hypothetical protein